MRYFFHIRDEKGVIRDEEGSELFNIAAAHHEARLSARDFLMEDIKAGVPLGERRIEIANEEGRVLAILQVSDIAH